MGYFSSQGTTSTSASEKCVRYSGDDLRGCLRWSVHWHVHLVPGGHAFSHCWFGPYDDAHWNTWYWQEYQLTTRLSLRIWVNYRYYGFRLLFDQPSVILFIFHFLLHTYYLVLKITQTHYNIYQWNDYDNVLSVHVYCKCMCKKIITIDVWNPIPSCFNSNLYFLKTTVSTFTPKL